MRLGEFQRAVQIAMELLRLFVRAAFVVGVVMAVWWYETALWLWETRPRPLPDWLDDVRRWELHLERVRMRRRAGRPPPSYNMGRE